MSEMIAPTVAWDEDETVYAVVHPEIDGKAFAEIEIEARHISWGVTDHYTRQSWTDGSYFEDVSACVPGSDERVAIPRDHWLHPMAIAALEEAVA